jgi:hydrogenase 3 maturation protease
MSKPSWQDLLQAKMARHPRPKVAILGIGHELRGDDAAGMIVARQLAARASDPLPTGIRRGRHSPDRRHSAGALFATEESRREWAHAAGRAGDSSTSNLERTRCGKFLSSTAAQHSWRETGESASAQAARPALTPPLIIEAGPAPEAFTGQLRRFDPDLVLLIDAAQMDLPPGAIRAIDWQGAIGLSASTHTLPLSVIARYVADELGCEVLLIGIQPQANEFDAPLSAPVRRAVDELTAGLSSLFASISA